MDLSQYISSIKVSSTLDDDSQFDKYHLIDGKLETCWNSDEGSIQTVYFKFSQPVDISHFELTFQGGFGAQHIAVSIGVPITQEQLDIIAADDDEDDETTEQQQINQRQIGLKSVAAFASQDVSSTQSFTFKSERAYAMKITFTEMADMFGRVILYNLNVFGNPSPI